MKTPNTPVFTAEDFSTDPMLQMYARHAADRANARLEQILPGLKALWLEELTKHAPTIEVDKSDFGWIGEEPLYGPTGRKYTAKLVCIVAIAPGEELKKD
jgi:hypothetical protein